jgi:hypothetical protein
LNLDFIHGLVQIKLEKQRSEMKKETPYADIRWIPDFQEKYAVWFREVAALLDAHQYPTAFKTYPFPAFEQAPWAPVRIPLAKGCLGIVSTAALYRRNNDTPFLDTVEGDSQVLELPGDVKVSELTTSHAHIPQDAITADANVALPLDALRAMVRDKQIGEIAPRFFSLNGYRSRADEVAMQTATKIAAAMADDGATHALIVPV